MVGKRGSEGEGREGGEEKGKEGDTRGARKERLPTGVEQDQLGKKGRAEEREGARELEMGGLEEEAVEEDVEGKGLERGSDMEKPDSRARRRNEDQREKREQVKKEMGGKSAIKSSEISNASGINDFDTEYGAKRTPKQVLILAMTSRESLLAMSIGWEQ